MKALENAKTMGEKEVIAKIASAGLQEYGVFPEALTGKWAAKQEETDGKVAGVAAGINNSDTKRVLLNLLRTDADKIFVIENGKVEECGTHEELLGQQKLYQKMWETHISTKDNGEENTVYA